MFRVLTVFSVALGIAGCWMPGEVREGMPRHTEKFAAGTAFFVADTEPRVKAALKQALCDRGFGVKDRLDDSDFLISAKVTKWEFNDAGFSGFHDRDDMTLAITVSDRATKLVRSRATVIVRSNFGIIRKYVDSL